MRREKRRRRGEGGLLTNTALYARALLSLVILVEHLQVAIVLAVLLAVLTEISVLILALLLALNLLVSRGRFLWLCRAAAVFALQLRVRAL